MRDLPEIRKEIDEIDNGQDVIIVIGENLDKNNETNN